MPINQRLPEFDKDGGQSGPLRILSPQQTAVNSLVVSWNIVNKRLRED